MCARFSVAGERVVRDLFGLDDDFIVHYNAAPTDVASIAVLAGDQLQIESASWGLRRHWSKKPLINVKSESMLTNGAFKDAFATQRCLVPATAFFEWESTAEGKKQPHLYKMADGRPFAFAGFYRLAKERMEFCILTTEPNALIERIHERMPAIVHKCDFETYLLSTPREAQAIALAQYPSEEMTSYLASPKMSSSKYKEADSIEPI